MFYAHFVLSKKGPLARIWLAAHWDKKLTKAHVFETNVESSVESIIHPKVKMALRTSGHLLLGVVRIHSRKAKYLLADCNEAFVKIKMAFRPGVVDLPEDNREAAFTAITLPEVFHDFDAPVPDYSDIDIQKQFTMNQSRVEEITMKEDFGNITLAGHDDGFGDIPFDDREVLRESTNMEETLYKPSGDESHLMLAGEKKDTTIDASLDKHMDLGYDKPLEDDGFGGGMGMGMGDGILGDGFLEEPNLFEEQPEITGTEVSLGGESSEKKDESPGKEGEKVSVQTAPEETPDQQMAAAVAAPPTPAPPTPAPPAADQTTLVQNEEEAFALEPIDVTGMKETRHRRKRKLVVDDVKELSGDIIKAQLKDTTDITSTLDLAPPTKKLMIWKETGGVDKLFSLPGRVAGSCLLKIFTRNLTTQKVVAKHGETEPEEEKMEVEEPEVPREEEVHEEEPVVREQESTLEVNESSRQEQKPEEKSAEPVPLPTMSPPPRPYSPSSDDGDMGDDLFGPDSVQSFGVEPQSESEDEEPQGTAESPEASQDEEEEDGDADTEEQDEKRWNKRTQQMIHVLQKQLQRQDQITFSELAKKNNRKQAASKFYTFLVLKKQNAIDVLQSEPFGEITVTKGPRFDLLL
ncbi:double-strand-break repair protein rad21 homolog isoform X2 [Ptychodera flava]|uniref:double-strand-break repair protein rad21 homolog isoform X2 n=1 Tax=Ptychodera flava TaxID=63121 RepID=UPI00396AA1F4